MDNFQTTTHPSKMAPPPEKMINKRNTSKKKINNEKKDGITIAGQAKVNRKSEKRYVQKRTSSQRFPMMSSTS